MEPWNIEGRYRQYNDGNTVVTLAGYATKEKSRTRAQVRCGSALEDAFFHMRPDVGLIRLAWGLKNIRDAYQVREMTRAQLAQELLELLQQRKLHNNSTLAEAIMTVVEKNPTVRDLDRQEAQELVGLGGE